MLWDKFKAVQVVASTVIESDPFNTWKSAFREATKLQSGIIDRQKQDESLQRLEAWCNVGNGKLGKYSIDGANKGKEFAIKHNLNDLSMGMSHDYLVALDFGSSFLRLGTCIFGERKP